MILTSTFNAESLKVPATFANGVEISTGTVYTRITWYEMNDAGRVAVSAVVVPTEMLAGMRDLLSTLCPADRTQQVLAPSELN